MAWIRTIGRRGAGPELDALYRQVADPSTGEPDNILAIHSLSPAGMRAHLTLYRHAMAGTEGLPKVDREMIALVVSRENACTY